MRKVSTFILVTATAAYAATTTGAVAADTCPTGYISVDMPDVEIAASCDTGYTSAGSIEDCDSGAGVCAVADTCGAGKYKDESGACQTCNIGYYCPGDDVQHYCTDSPDNHHYYKYQYEAYSDETGATECKLCPTDTESEAAPYFRSYWFWSEEAYIHTTKSQCRVDWAYTTDDEYIFTSCSYGDNGYMQPGSAQKCLVQQDSYCAAGYYINPTNPIITKYDGQGRYWTDRHSYLETIKCEPVGIGYYSPAKTSLRTKCPDGYTTRTETAPAETDCVPLCTAGATMLHVGPHVFNLYPDSACERPAIHIGLPNGTCCAHLEKGEVSGALHVRYNDTVYHTTN